MISVCEAKGSGSFCFFIRHAEKDIRNFGLTERGRSEIVEFSNLLLSTEKSVLVYSSPENRCIETASIINERVNGGGIVVSDVLGKPGIQVRNEMEYNKLTDIMRCRDIYRGWKNGMYNEAMNSPEELRPRITGYLEETFLKAGITIYISQSGTVACTGYSLGLTDYKADDADWVGFLDGYMLRL